ncbi:MAG: DUF393 domain-containing protein [Pyrinomonadaceae bacterium]|nr:DUF393 domain-containing protein [Pyrinomonadaceae bacterium]
MGAENYTIVLFDGVCNFCNSSVNYIIERDLNDRFKFAPLQSEAAAPLIAKHGIDREETDSLILIENETAYVYSTASLRIAKKLGGINSLAYGFVIVPKFIRDFFYKLFAKYRYKLFGKKEVCMVPTPEVREKFLV